jgi:transposase
LRCPLIPVSDWGDWMTAGILSMRADERERLHLVKLTGESSLTQREAADRLGISERQFKRLVQRWKREGDAGLIFRQRGRASNNRLAEADRVRIVGLLRDRYPDFGPTLAAEKLLERDGIQVSRETVRRLQIEAKLWRPKRRRAKRIFQIRDRRPRFGELVQIDGSPHAWLEDRGPRCALIVFIDDATGRLIDLRFASAETTRAYLLAVRSHVLTYGRPLAYYSDRHGIFRVNAKEPASGDGKTEFGRAMERLGIETIQASTPQAKGRVERSNQTLQDRLIKEMRLRGIATMAEAQAYAPEFIAFWNRRLAVEARDPGSAHRPWTGSEEDLDTALARRDERTLSKALTFSMERTLYCVKTSGPGTALRGAKVELLHFLDGRMQVRYKNRLLECTAFKRSPRPAETEDEKTLDARVDLIVAAARSQPPMGTVRIGVG